MTLSPSQRSRRRRQAEDFTASVPDRMREIGGKADLLNAENYHYRLTGPKGGRIDFWASTGRWFVTMDRARNGRSIQEMLALLSTLEEKQQPALDPPNEDLVTIFADGSYDTMWHVGGVGFFIMSQGNVLKGGEQLYDCHGSTDCEALALAIAMRKARDAGLLRSGARVMLESDCTAVLGAICKKVPGTQIATTVAGGTQVYKARRLMNGLATSKGLLEIIEITEALRLRLTVRHVKGHQGSDRDGRGELNALCDRTARNWMKAARDITVKRAKNASAPV